MSRIPQSLIRRSAVRVLPLVVVLAGCVDRTEPVAPTPVADPVEQAQTRPMTSLLSERVHVVDPEQIDLLSGPVERADGLYRLRSRTGEALAIEPGDFLLGWTGQDEIYIRQVTAAAAPGDDLELVTEEAYWPQVLAGGTYGFTMPLVQPPGGISGDAVNVPFDPNAPLAIFNMDFCNKTGLDGLPAFMQNVDICNLPNDGKCFSKGWVEVCGNISTLTIQGRLTWGGEMEFTMNVDPGRFVPPVPPVFFPCNVNPAACLFTGVCVPGTSVLVRAWPPAFQTCVLVRAGSGPQVTLPHIKDAGVTTDPQLAGNVVVHVVGTGKVELEIPIPKLSFSTDKVRHWNGIRDSTKVAELKGGLFLVIAAETRVDATAAIDSLDQRHDYLFGYRDAGGWGMHTLSTPTKKGTFNLFIVRPDTINIRVAALVQLALESKVLPIKGPKLLTGYMEFGAGLQLPFFDAVWSRPPLANWSVDTDIGIGVEAEAKLALPLGFSKRTGIGLEHEWEYELVRTDFLDLWGRGEGLIEVNVSGTDFDPDGFVLNAARVDGLLVPPYSDTMRTQIAGAGGSTPFRAMSGNATAKACARWFAGWPFNHLVPPLYVHCDAVAEPHRLFFTGLAPNCSVRPRRIQSVWHGSHPQVMTRFGAADTTRFWIECRPLDDASTAVLRVTSVTRGNTAEDGGYRVLVNDTALGAIAPNDVTLLTGLTPGTLRVLLDEVASYCLVETENPVTVDVAAGDTASVSFDTYCPLALPSQSGTLQLVTVTTGDNPDPDGYTVLIDGTSVGFVASTGTLALHNLAPGAHTLELIDVAGNCVVAGEHPRTLTVAGGVTADETVRIVCSGEELRGDLSVIVSTIGDQAPDAFMVRAGRAEASVGARDTAFIAGLPEGNLAVRLEDVPAGCAVPGRNPQTAAISSVLTAQLTFFVFCLPGSVGWVSANGDAQLLQLLAMTRGAIMPAEPAMVQCWGSAYNRGENRGRVLEGHLARLFETCFRPQTVSEQTFEIGFAGALEGTATMTRIVAQDGLGNGGVIGTIEIRGTWNGVSGVFRGVLAGTVTSNVLEAIVVAPGEGAFGALQAHLVLSGPLEGPLSYTGQVRAAGGR